MYCIQYDEICKKHNFELKHDARGDGVTLEYPADSVPKDTLRLFQNHLPEEVSAMAEKYSSDRFADELNKKFNEKERLTPAQRLFFWTEYKKPIE